MGRLRVEAAAERPHGLQSYREWLPPPALRRHATCVWVQQVSPDSSPYVHRTIPNGSAELVCVVGATPKLVGPQTGPMEERLAAGTTAVGVRFRPGAAPSVLGLPGSEVVDLVLASDELWGRAAVALGERVAAAASPRDAAAVLEAAVHSRLADASEPDPIAEEATRRLSHWRTSDVRALAASLYVSERQLRRRCEAAIGVTPKVVHRILRFQRFLALTRTRDRPAAELALIAREAGFADQAHLSREALRLAGRTPRLLLHEARECLATHDHAASFGPLLRSLELQALATG